MKAWVSILMLLCFTFVECTQKKAKLNTTLFGQVKVKPDTTVYSAVEINPVPPGGDAAIGKYMIKVHFIGNEDYPTDEQGNIEMSFVVAFIVEKDGSLSSFTRLRGSIQNCNEIIRVLKTMPKWSPGMMKGKPVRTQYTAPLIL